MIIYWPMVFVVSIALYVLTIITFPFSQTYSTVFMFALLSYWSRIPGVGIPSPFFIIYLADFVDFFSLIVAINLGGFQGAVFSVFANAGSRMVGITPPWRGVMKDTIIQFVICFFIPAIHHFTGSDVFLSMLLYTILRRIGFIIAWFFDHTPPLPQFIVLWNGVTAGTLLINGIYAHYLGDYFDGLLQQGIQFNWGLFLLCTVIIFGTRIYLKGINVPDYSKFNFSFMKIKSKKNESSEEVEEDLRMLRQIKYNIDAPPAYQRRMEHFESDRFRKK